MSLPVSLKQLLQDYQFPSNAPPSDLEDSNSTVQCRRTRDILKTLDSKYQSEKSNAELIHDLAIVNFARGFILRAEELFISAKNLDAQNPYITYNLGILYYNARRYKQAEQEWLSSLKLNPAFGNAYLDLTYLYYEQGLFEQAWTNCQLTLKQGISVPDGLILEIRNNLHVKGKQQ